MTIPTFEPCLFVAAFGLAACGMLPPKEEQPFASALPPSPDSPLARVARESAPDPTLSGFRLMPLGPYALDARIELIRRAQSSLDVQYYLIQDDRTGRLFMRSLRDAAQRGVRVRLLVDDLYTAGADPMFQGLAAFPNVEVRLFNPFCRARQSIAEPICRIVADVRRLNHRMHNKLFIADDAFVVMGGRNIADEYFCAGIASNFVDMDVLLAGNVVQQLAGIFDIYWNSRAGISHPDHPWRAYRRPAERAERFNRWSTRASKCARSRSRRWTCSPSGRSASSSTRGGCRLLREGRVAFADQPAKVMATSDEMARSMSVQMNIMDRVVRSTRQVVMSSPYFVPGPTGVEAFTDLTQRGVEVVILTNSLAANDEPLAHIGYARYRASLVRAGVELYELSPARVHGETWDAVPGMSHGRLHAKVAVIDDSMVYVGSMNLDPRSESTNTELGIVAHVRSLRGT